MAGSHRTARTHRGHQAADVRITARGPPPYQRALPAYREVLRDEERLEQLAADPLAHNAAVLRDAMDLQTEALALPGHSGGEDSYTLGLVRPCTVHQTRLVALGGAKTSSLANVAAAQVWEPIRTLDARETRAHFYPWIAHMRPKVQREVIARWMKQISSEWLPGRAIDVYQRRLHSGFPAGPEKRKDGWAFCARCRQSLGLSQCTAAQHEGVIHMCESCPSPGGATEVLAVCCTEARSGSPAKRFDAPARSPCSATAATAATKQTQSRRGISRSRGAQHTQLSP